MAIKVENLKLISLFISGMFEHFLTSWALAILGILWLKTWFSFLMNNTDIIQGTSKITFKTGLGLTLRFPNVHWIELMEMQKPT